jgi:hypothetical protein
MLVWLANFVTFAVVKRQDQREGGSARVAELDPAPLLSLCHNDQGQPWEITDDRLETSRTKQCFTWKFLFLVEPKIKIYFLEMSRSPPLKSVNFFFFGNSGLFVCKQVTICPGHIWTTLYIQLLQFKKHTKYLPPEPPSKTRWECHVERVKVMTSSFRIFKLLYLKL